MRKQGVMEYKKAKFKYLKVNSKSAELFIQYADWGSTTFSKISLSKKHFS